MDASSNLTWPEGRRLFRRRRLLPRGSWPVLLALAAAAVLLALSRGGMA